MAELSGNANWLLQQSSLSVVSLTLQSFQKECSERQEVETISPLRPGPKIGSMSLLPYSMGRAITSPVYAVRERNGKEYVAIFNPSQRLFTKHLQGLE